jgi:DNA replication and repair protein RecF
MKIERLQIQGLRCLSDVSLTLGGGISFFSGDNGAGKSSLLEAVFMLSHGRSFRSGARDALLQRGASTLNVFAEVRMEGAALQRLGLGREGSRWKVRVDGESVPLSRLVRSCAVVSFDPGSHALIAGAADERRRFLDWGVFHVEHTFLSCWSRYQRSLKQRNSLLRSASAVDTALFDPWERELSDTALVLDEFRRAYLARLSERLVRYAKQLLPELGAIRLDYRRGWSEQSPLSELLSGNRQRDLARGHTSLGPHRADWSVSFEHAPMREHLSRGQEKLTALVCLLAQADLYAQDHRDWPIFCLDDLASELDSAHQQALVEQLGQVGAQILITGTEAPAALLGATYDVFHVERGQVGPLL